MFFILKKVSNTLAGNSQVKWFEDNYLKYEENHRERLGISEDQPERIQYKKLMRE